jgi:hypothetical protein
MFCAGAYVNSFMHTCGGFAFFYFYIAFIDFFHLNSVHSIWEQGCQIFLGTTYKNGEILPNKQKMYPMAIKYNI